MMRVVLFFVLCGALWAEVRMNIEQLRAFVYVVPEARPQRQADRRLR